MVAADSSSASFAPGNRERETNKRVQISVKQDDAIKPLRIGAEGIKSSNGCVATKNRAPQIVPIGRTESRFKLQLILLASDSAPDQFERAVSFGDRLKNRRRDHGQQ